MAGWKKFEIKLPDIPTGDLTGIIEKIKEFINVIVTILDTILNLIAAFLDPLASAIKAIINAIKKAIESFLEDMGVYLLYVPIRKRLMTNFLGFGDITPEWASDSMLFSEPQSAISADDPVLNEFIVNANRYNGGNGGFFRTVLESLSDEGDINRPQFDNDSDYVGGLIILMGTDFDPLGFLDDIWRLFGLFGDLFPDTVPKLPRPKNLRGRAITKVLGGSFSVLLNWDPVEVPLVHIEDLGGTMYYPTRYAVIRVKNDVRALSAASVIDLMGTRKLSVGTKFNGGNAVIVAEEELDISSVSYIDSNVSATKDDAFYYAIAWKLTAYNQDDTVSQDTGTPLDYWYISNVVRVVPFPTLPTATPPNWIRTPSIASLFPPFADLLRRFVLELENLADKLLGVVDLLKQYVDFLKSEIARYEALINYILDEIAKLTALFDLPTAGIYMRTFKGKGGNIFFETDLAKSLLPGYPGCPPFNKGDEFVTGVIIMTGGYLPDVEAFIAALELFFGGGGDGGMSDLIAQLGEQVEQLEEVTFGDDMAVSEAKAPVQFDRSMCPLNTCCNPQIPPEPVAFKANFTTK
jgi:hypothetical protein